jgi:hypothetical protein
VSADRWPDGITFAELKALLAEWPDADAAGVPFRVRVRTPGGDAPVSEIHVANGRAPADGADFGADFVLLSRTSYS